MAKAYFITDAALDRAHRVASKLYPFTPRVPVLEEGGATLQEVGDALGVSRERARQIEKIALDKLRAYAKERGLRLEDFLR